MTDEITPQEGNEAPVEPSPTPSDEATAAPTPDAATLQAEIDRLTALNQKLRKESADKRVKAREASAESEAAKSQLTELQETVAQINARLEAAEQARLDAEQKAASAARQSLISDLANQYGLPPRLAARLQGDTAEELEADAKALAEELPKGPRTPAVKPTNSGEAGPVSAGYKLYQQMTGETRESLRFTDFSSDE